ncbi:outer membrane beta-barrel protein [Flavobacterium sp. LC2016-23]|uniref:porin family protein n=1 Tax=Flavobacterium sp. LC2016-23 TaxID=2666330 RepID=UPI0012B15DF6|nr:porin family protein [Flavobacterium sp. LC2016-23]MRX39202.1 outer membrane beta-barrel protein [Flavobacterium sp. LC2016-23]
MRLLFSCLFLVSFFTVFSQEETKPKIEPIVKIDSLYREDQFYFSVTYNLFANIPPGLKQDKFSVGLSGGFLRDMPINKKRTLAFATGLGLSYQNFFQNFTISKDGQGALVYNVNDYNEIVSNRYRQYLIDLPIEFRWRNSTYESYKFWRVYGGLKVSYAFSTKSAVDDGETTYKVTNNPDINKLQYGTYLAAGYNTWNVYIYYGLNPLFKSSVKTISGQNVNIQTINAGLIFYIL